MQIIPPPDPIATDATRAAYKHARNNQGPLPVIHSGESQKPDSAARASGLHLSNRIQADTAELYGVSLGLCLPLALQIIMQSWELVPLTLSLISLNLLAVRYAKRPRITHRFARTLRAVYFITFGHPGTRHPARYSLRMPIQLLAPILILALCGAIWLAPRRTPLVDTRYLRKNTFFREALKVQLEIETGKRPREDSLLDR